jgi:hypothetical protein
MHRWLGRAIVATALVLAIGHTARSSPGAEPLLRHDRFDLGAPGDGSWRAVADPTGGCGPVRLGETTVATPAQRADRYVVCQWPTGDAAA